MPAPLFLRDRRRFESYVTDIWLCDSWVERRSLRIRGLPVDLMLIELEAPESQSQTSVCNLLERGRVATPVVLWVPAMRLLLAGSHTPEEALALERPPEP
jgi:hypothetical protein